MPHEQVTADASRGPPPSSFEHSASSTGTQPRAFSTQLIRQPKDKSTFHLSQQEQGRSRHDEKMHTWGLAIKETDTNTDGSVLNGRFGHGVTIDGSAGGIWARVGRRSVMGPWSTTATPVVSVPLALAFCLRPWSSTP